MLAHTRSVVVMTSEVHGGFLLFRPSDLLVTNREDAVQVILAASGSQGDCDVVRAPADQLVPLQP